MISSKKFYEVKGTLDRAKAVFEGMPFRFDGMSEDYAYFSVITTTDNIEKVRNSANEIQLGILGEYHFGTEAYKAEFRMEL